MTIFDFGFTSFQSIFITDLLLLTLLSVDLDMQEQLLQLIQIFFDPSIPYNRKQEADHHLTQFRKQHNAWQLCQPLIREGQSDNVLWYCLSVCEEMIAFRWSTLSDTERNAVKVHVVHLFQHSALKLSSMVLNKLLKIITDIARREWPHHFPELLPMIQTLMFEREARPIGLRLLKMITEDFVSSKTDLSTARRTELKSQFLHHVPAIIESMKQILDDAYDAPSAIPLSAHPTFTSYDSLTVDLHVHQRYPMASPLTAGSSIGINKPPRGTFDPTTLNVCELALEILLQLFSWIPLAQNVSLPLLNTILKYAQLSDAATVQLGQAAMACINEILTRNCVPHGFQEFLFLIFRHVFDILKYLTEDTGDCMIDDLDEDYRLKFTEFVSAFIQLHIHRFENDPNFPMGAFLELLYKFTYHQPSVEALQDCLTIWNTFFDYLLMSKERGSLVSDKYKNGLIEFNKQLAQRVQFTTNAADLSGIEDDVENSQGQTDYDLFLNDWVDMLAKLAELYPSEVVGFLVQLLQEHMNKFQQTISTRRNDDDLEGSAQMSFLHKDLRACLRAFGRMSDLFVRSFEGTFDLVYGMLNAFHEVLRACLKKFEENQDLPDFVKLTVETYAVQLAFINWMETFQRTAKVTPSLQDKLDHLCSNTTNWCLMCFKKDVPAPLSLVAGKLFHALCVTVKPTNLFKYPNVGDTLSNLHDISIHLTKPVKILLYQATSSACLSILPEGADVSDGGLVQQYQQFVSGLTVPFVQLFRSDMARGDLIRRSDVRGQILHVVNVLTALVEGVEGEKIQIKAVLYDVIKESIPCTVELFEISIEDPEILREVMSYFLALFGALKKQVHHELASKVLETFCNLINNQRMESAISNEVASDVEFITKFFQILVLLVSDNSKAFEHIIPSIMDFTVDRATSIMQRNDNDSSESIQSSYFALIHSILLNHWRYFFPASGISKIARVREHAVAESNERRLQLFAQLLHPFVVSFKQPSLTIFKRNLELLDDLNLKCRLFNDDHFATHYMASFQNGLMMVLVEKTHDLLRDEIIAVLFAMYTAHREPFYQAFLPNFLKNFPDLSVNCQNEMAQYMLPVHDAPSFAEQINRFVDDIAFYRKTQ